MIAPVETRLSLRLGKSYKGLQQCLDRFVVVEGPRGTAKTRTILTLQVLSGLAHPGSRIALARATRTALTETVLNTLEEQVFPALKLDVPGGAGRENRSTYRLDNGTVIVPIGLDDPEQKKKLFSSEWTKIYVAEASDCEEESIKLLGPTLRHYPKPNGRGEDGYVQCILDHNPLAPGHWIYKVTEDVDLTLRRAVNGFVTREDYARIQLHNLRPSPNPKRQWKRIITKHMDNPGYWDTDKWGYSVPLGQNYLETLDYMTGFMRRRMLDGEPCAAEGGVFENDFMAQKDGKPWHVVPAFNPPNHWPGLLACDPGYAHVLAMPVAVVGPNGRIFFCAERVKAQSTIPEHAAWLTDYERRCGFIIRRKLGDPHDMFKKTLDGGGVSKADQFAALGHRFEAAPAANNGAELSSQIEMMRTGLTRILGDGKPAIQFMDNCPFMITAMQSHSYKKNTKGQLTGSEDQYEEKWKDEIDAGRMIVASRPVFEVEKCVVMA